MPAYRQTDQLFVTCVAGRKNYVSTIISGGEIGVNRKRKQGDLRGRRFPCFSLDLKLFGSDAPAFSLLADGGEAPVQAVLLHELGVRAVLGDPAVCHDEDLVGVLDGREAVASSRMMMGVFLSIMRAMAMRCFSPPESVPPPSPTTVS